MLEELLNKLIEKGWKPFGKKYKNVCREPNKRHSYMFDYDVYYRREIVSKESGLWQFVCENGMVNINDTPEENAINLWRYNKKDSTEWWYRRNYQYRLIESALKDESELEEFLLNSIKIGNEQR